jgi:curved DNA-binding protein CbpA
MNTLYDLLGVSPDATLTQIELAFRRSLAAHLARNGMQPGREQSHLQAIKAAYGVLSSPVRREFYDHKLNARRGQQGKIAADVGSLSVGT